MNAFEVTDLQGGRFLVFADHFELESLFAGSEREITFFKGDYDGEKIIVAHFMSFKSVSVFHVPADGCAIRL